MQKSCPENGKIVLQGVSFEILGFQMAVVLKLCIIDPMLVKPKIVWETVAFSIFENLFTLFKMLNETPCIEESRMGIGNSQWL